MAAVCESSTSLSTSFPGARILVVDDESSLRETLCDVLTRIGYTVFSVGCGADALGCLAQREFDVVLLDLRMPDIDGTDVLREAGMSAPDTIFIIMTAFGTLESAITGLRHGAFDYLQKPSPLKEIVQTIESGLLKRHSRHQHETNDPIGLLEEALARLKSASSAAAPREDSDERFLKFSGFSVDTQKRLVLSQGVLLDLTPTEFDILVYLLRHRHRVVSAAELVDHLRGFELSEREASDYLRSHIHRLRKKLSQDSEREDWIETVRGQGLIFRQP